MKSFIGTAKILSQNHREKRMKNTSYVFYLSTVGGFDLNRESAKKEITMFITYNPKAAEEKQYQFWLDNELFKASGDDTKETFSIVLPPPNITEMLHMDHVLNFTLQDIFLPHAKKKNRLFF
jgi:valyl-tRNA synthetase